MTDAPSQHVILLNGAERSVPVGCTVAMLLESLGLRRDGVAVAIDMHVVPRSTHAERVIEEGARVEVVQAVGGG